MKLKLVRTDLTENSTIGELYIDGQFECYILEDTVRNEKIAGKTAIPYGTYDVAITYSPRFTRYLPLLLNVPNYSGIRIHKGNYPKDTEGCLLPGRKKSKDAVLESALAFDRLYPKLVYANQHGDKITIEIVPASGTRVTT